MFIDRLAQRQDSKLLDVGPVCAENINVLARQAVRLYVCDMFIRLHRERDKTRPFSSVWRHLDYPDESFDGILLWDLVDRLDDSDAYQLLRLCHTMLKRGGMLVVFFLGEQGDQELANSFVIGEEGFKVYTRAQTHLRLPLRRRNARDVLEMLSPFNLIKSIICSNGLREFLLQRI